MKLPAKDPVSSRVFTLSLLPSRRCCDDGEMKKGMRSESVETVDNEVRLHNCIPLGFFATCVVSAVDAAGFEDVDDDDEEEEEDEEDDEEDDFKPGIILACGSLFINSLCPCELRNGVSVLLKYGDEVKKHVATLWPGLPQPVHLSLSDLSGCTD
jgi:hypothetical protein